MDIEEYRTKFSAEGAAPGWQAIDDRLGEVYPGVKPEHWGTLISYSLGGPDPLDGVSAYPCTATDGSPYFHYVSYGLSNLYRDEEAVGGEYSGFGFELTMRVKAAPNETAAPMWPVALMQQLARYVFDSGNVFDDNHWAGTSSGNAMGDDPTSELTGLAFITDPTLGVIDTPHGRVQFLQMLGLTTAEMKTLPGPGARARCAAIIETLKAADPLLVTDLQRRS